MPRKPTGTDLLHQLLVTSIKEIGKSNLLKEYFLDCPSRFGLENSANCSKESCTDCQLSAIGAPVTEEMRLYVEMHILK